MIYWYCHKGKGDINSWKFYEKSWNMLRNIMKNVVKELRAIEMQNVANVSRDFHIFIFNNCGLWSKLTVL